MSDNKNLDAAIKYATKYGFAVFPVVAHTKRPITPHGCKDAKKDVGAIKARWKRHPDASIGIATGSISQLIVIDEDVDPNTGLDGTDSIRTWERNHAALPETARAITGRGGVHLYYHYAGSDIKNSTGLLEGVDVRGEGGYVVAPPSTHPNGTEYAWEDDPDDIGIVELNDTVRELLDPKKKQGDSEEFTLPDKIQSGSRNDTLFRLACSLQAQGLPDTAILVSVQSVNAERCDVPVPEEELETLVNSALRYEKGQLKAIQHGMPEWHEPKLTMRMDKDGNVTDQPAQTIANAEEAIRFDPELFGKIRYNEVAYAPYVMGALPWKPERRLREWTNADDSNLRSYIEAKYGIKSGEKIMDALNNVISKQTINPIKAALENAHDLWDGNKHVENLLPAMLGAEKTEYTTAVMKLFMMGAVARIYRPGCKFDHMMVLVGEQGGGKSTFLRFLSINDDWFSDNFNSLDGDKASEKLRGMWMVELAELQATKRAKDVETIKAFITSRVDTYRVPYGRRTEQRPRMCVLAGTSNPVDFLTDKTGNRRFLPITCWVRKPTFDMFADEIATKAEFVQAWGEIMDEYQRKGGKVSLVLPKRLQDKAIEMQTAYLEEDPKIGIIQEWLDTNPDISRVCAVMLWKEALKHEYEPYKPQDINAIHEIMKNSITGWRYAGKQMVGREGYGVQRCYDRIYQFIPADGDMNIPFD